MSVIRAGICVLIAFAVLAHGGVESWAEAVLEVGAAFMLLIWAWQYVTQKEFKLTWNPLFVPLAGVWVIGAVQSGGGFSLIPFLTRMELVRYTALLILFFLCVQSFRTWADWRGYVWFLLILGFCIALLGILQHFTWNGKLYWIREMRYGGMPFGPYVNRNHFAGLMEMLIPTGLAVLVLEAEDRDRLPLLTLFVLLPIGAIFLSASRGGIISFFAELGCLAVLVFLRQREKKALVAAGLVAALAIVLVSWLGIGAALDRFAGYKKLEVTEGRRVGMFYSSLRIFRDYPVLGTGLGTLQEVFPRYDTVYDGYVVNHSHNDYAEALAETGALGGIFFFSCLVLLAWTGWKNLVADHDKKNLAYHAGAIVACFGLLVHSLVDFNLHIPSNALLFAAQAALVTCALPQPAERKR